MPRADEETLQRVRVVLAEAMDKGLDAAEALDRAGLLSFEERDVHLRIRNLGNISDMVDVVTVKEIARAVEERMPTSALDTKRQIVAWLRLIKDQGTP